MIEIEGERVIDPQTMLIYYKRINARLKGKLSEADIHWRVKKNVPEVPAPLLSGENIYMIKNGGIITCANLKSGEVHYCERLGVAGPYIASPVAANGRIYIPTNKGVIIVLNATNELNILAKNDLNEKIYATPAIVGNTIYVRTATHLYAFGEN